LPEAIVHGETGILVENRMEDISNAMLLVAGDAQLAESMGAAAHRRAAERFSVERMIEGALHCYEKAARA
jgi:glycosyltransferase involved in cell wall biosynthesis